jgi:apolipoprotein N-acyltransferase
MTALLAALLGGIMLYLSQGLADVWALAWIAPAPLLWLAYGDTSRWQVLVASLAAFAIGETYLLQCYWGQIPLAIIAPLAGVVCAAFALAVLFSGEALRRGSPWAALLAFPVLFTVLEYAIALVSRHGSYGALGYAEVPFPASIQVAALFGVHAVSFLLCLSAGAVALLTRRLWMAGGVGVAVCALALVFGFARLGAEAGPSVQVAALADADAWHAENRERTVASEKAAADAYGGYIESLTGVRVVVIPEGAMRMQQSDVQDVLAPLAAAARTSEATVVVGTFTPEPAQNRAFTFLPDGAVETYSKRHLLVPLETGVPGRGAGFLGRGYATQICKDMDFDATVRGTAGHGVRLMIVPANDFGADGWIHARMAVMQGVENGFAVLRSAFNGLETVSDAYGRILASAPTSRAGMVAVTADVPLGPGPTLYTRIGDVFPWLCAAASLVLGAWMLAGARLWARRVPAVELPRAANPGI